jgi:hypothetical protein
MTFKYKNYLKLISKIIFFFWIIALTLLCGCGQSPSDPGTKTPTSGTGGRTNSIQGSFYANVSQELGIHYVNFLNQGYGHGMDLSLVSLEMQFDLTLPSTKAANCTPANSTTAAKVQINPTYWTSLSDSQKENLVFRQLGRCLLNRGTRIDTNNSIALSIMYPSLITPESAYQANYTQYMYELFRQTDLISQLPLKLN